MVNKIVKTLVLECKKYSFSQILFGIAFLLLFAALLTIGQDSFRQSRITAIYGVIDDASYLKVRNIRAESSNDLNTILKDEGYDWPPSVQQSWPPLILTKLPDDFADLPDHRKRQKLFLSVLLPIVLVENRRIRDQRKLVELLFSGKLPSKNSDLYAWLQKTAKRYGVKGEIHLPDNKSRLLKRLDEIPPALALAQSAIETGWGTSRFALEGNSLFGQWTYLSTNGLKPSERDAEASHMVASYSTLRKSVRAYMRNLNIGHAYHEFREARAALRDEDNQLSAEELASYLQRYSQRGEKYVSELKRMIKSRHIAFLANTSFSEEDRKLVVASLEKLKFIKKN